MKGIKKKNDKKPKERKQKDSHGLFSIPILAEILDFFVVFFS